MVLRGLMLGSACVLVLAAACSSSSEAIGGAGGLTATSAHAGGEDATGSTQASGASGSSTTAASGPTSSGTGGGGAPTAAQLLALTTSCTQASTGLYKSDDETSADIAICSLSTGFFWHSDLDVDCDGKTTPQCNPRTDGAYQNETSATDSSGDPLDAAALPFVVIPLPSSRFDYGAEGIELGAVVAVIYQGQVVYGVFGDEGPNDIIGEASYAMASALGIDPDPSTGGVDEGVTFIVFEGPGGVVSPIEDHDAATELGETLAAALVANGG